MADSRVLIEIVSTAKGLKVVAKDTEKLAKNVDKVDTAQKKAEKSGAKYHKTEKGIHQANLSSAKGFSKMNQSIGGGSSGLVGAYATLAANVFAATAAFNALRSAAQVATLVEGFTFLADTAGRTSTVISRNIQGITNNALSMEQAMRTSAIAITSGFSTTQLERLVTVGKNASIALGRNLGDSIDRLIRGVAKLEPEILDELGILVRVDTASRKYAAGLGKVASELTDFEKRQAFLNATIEQGEEKYAALTAAIDINAFDKLAGTFANMTQNVLNLVNTALKPLIAFFAQSQIAMFGAITFLAKGVIGTMFPMLTDLGKRYTDTAQKAHLAADAMKNSSETAFKAAEKATAQSGSKKTDPGGFKAMVASAKKGALSQKEINSGLKSLRISEKLRAKALDGHDKKDQKRKTKELKRIRDLIKETEKLKDVESKRGQASVGSARSGGRANEQDIIATGAGAIGGAGGMAGFGIASETFGKLRGEIKTTDAEITKSFGKEGQSKMQRFGQSTRNGFKLASGGVRLFGAAAINAIPMIGQIIFVVGILINIFTKLFGMSAKVSQAFKNLNEVVEKMPDKFKTLSATTEVLQDRIKTLSVQMEVAETSTQRLDIAYDINRQKALMLANEIKVTAGVLLEFSDSTTALGNEINKADPSRFTMMMANLGTSFREQTGDVFNLKNGTLAFLRVLAEIPMVGATAAMALELFDNDAKKAGLSAEEIDSQLNTDKWILYTKGILDAQAQLENDEGSKKAVEQFGDLDKILLDAAKHSDSFAVRAAFVARELKKVSDEAGAADAAIEAIGPAMEQVTKKMIAFADRNSKKNEFITMGKDLGEFSKILKDLVKTSGEMTADELLNIEIPRELSDVMTAYGLTREQVLGTLKQEVLKNGEIKVSGEDQFQKLQERFNLHGLAVEKLKEDLAERTKILAAQKQEIAFQEKSFEIRLKQSQLAQTGVYEMNPRDEQKLAKESHKLKEGFINDQYLTELANAAQIRDTAMEDARLTTANNKVLLEQKLADARKVFNAEAELADKKFDREQQDIADILAIKQASAGTEGTTLERLGSLSESRDGTEGFQQKIKDMQNASQPMLDTLKSMGPDGEFAAAAIEGTLSIASSIGKIGDASLSTADRVGAAADVIGAIGGIMAASSKQQIAEVDKQIAAEKNRDGKSKESLAKIAAMEKKKDQMKRKAFEQNKKMQMAETVVNTAAAIMAQKGNLPMMLLMGILGAAQLAVIAKTSYQSTGGAIEQPKRQELSIGKRSNKVDVSNATSGGELSFLRGNKGVGSNANSFTPGGAAGMKRSYAAGGEILVGEQGPEVIKPTADGYNVIPNDRMGGGTTNANFTINAVDAAGVEEVLMKQRGNIIGMIREAAHEHGEEFIEAVNPSAYGIPMEK